MKLVACSGRALACAVLAALWLAAVPARAAELNAYSIWPENWARPMFEEFEKATGIKVNFVRFSSGEALARVIAEKNNPQVDVLFGGPVETFAAGINEGVFEPYKPPSFAKLPARFRHAEGQWIAIADDPLVFMANASESASSGASAVARTRRRTSVMDSSSWMFAACSCSGSSRGLDLRATVPNARRDVKWRDSCAGVSVLFRRFRR